MVGNAKSFKQVKSILMEFFTLKSGSHLERKLFLFKKFFKKDEKGFFIFSKFCPDFSGHVGKRLDMKAKVNSEFMTSQTGKQTIIIHILPNISRSKGNQTMKFRQLT